MNHFLLHLWQNRASFGLATVIFALPFLRLIPFGISLAQFISILVCISLLAFQRRSNENSPARAWFIAILVAFNAWIALSTAIGLVRNTIDPQQGLRDIRDFAICTFVLISIILSRHQIAVKPLILFAVFAQLIELSLRTTAVYTKLFNPPFEDIRFQAGFLSPNEYAAFAGILGCGSLGIALTGRVKQILFLLPVGISLIVILSTHSRGGLLSMILGSVAAMLLCFRRPYAIGLSLIMILSMGYYYRSAAPYEEVFERVGNRFDERYLAEGVGVRSELAHSAYQIFLEYPVFGAGSGGFAEIGGHETTSPHNEYLKVAAEAGVVGVLFLTALFVLPLYWASGIPEATIRVPLAVMLISFYSNEFFYSHLSRPNLTLVYAILVGLVINKRFYSYAGSNTNCDAVSQSRLGSLPLKA